MATAVPREERHALPLQATNADCVARRSVGRLDVQLFEVNEAGHFVEARAADHREGDALAHGRARERVMERVYPAVQVVAASASSDGPKGG